MDESRKAFEKWALEVMQFTPDDLAWDERRNCYRDYVPHMAWKGWQASRSAIEIIAPKFIDSREALAKGYTVDYSNGFGDAMDAYEKAIRAAGIKVKE